MYYERRNGIFLQNQSRSAAAAQIVFIIFSGKLLPEPKRAIAHRLRRARREKTLFGLRIRVGAALGEFRRGCALLNASHFVGYIARKRRLFRRKQTSYWKNFYPSHFRRRAGALRSAFSQSIFIRLAFFVQYYNEKHPGPYPP